MKLIKYLALLCTPVALFSCGGNKKNYTVTFDLNGGYGDFPSQTVVEGTYVNDPGTPQHDNTREIRYTFDYWSCNGSKYEFHTVPITQDTTLKAEWKETTRIYHTVSFDTNGGEPTINPIEVEDGFTMDPPGTVPIKAADKQYTYQFKEWQLNGSRFDFESTPITADGITLKADYYATLNKYTVTFDSDGGTAVSPQSVDYGGYAIEPDPAPSKPSTHDYKYELEYWMDENEDKFEFTTTQIFDHITLKAKWKSIARVYHMVSFDTDGGEPTINPVEVEHGSTMTKPKTVPIKAADPQYTYAFNEWQLNGQTFNFESTPITDGIELKADYNKILRNYQVTFETDGGTTIEPQTVDYGGHATKPETDPIKRTELLNYPFVRWEDKDGNEFDFDNTEIVGPTTIYAKWGTAVNWWLDDDYIAGLTDTDVGITRGITVNNKIHSVRLIGIDDDTIANSNDKAHTTWEFATLFSNSSGNAECCSWERNDHYWHATEDYINSGMRKSIDGGGTADKTAWESKTQYNVLSKLPETLQGKLKTVTKYVNTRPDSGSAVETSYNTSLFQLSTLEMGYSDTYAEKTNVSRYDYYSDATGETSSKRVKRDYNGNTKKIWLRSPYAYAITSMSTWNEGWIVGTDGKMDDWSLVLGFEVEYLAVAPAFCL